MTEKAITYLSPWMIARYPKISEPDNNGTFADGKYKTDALFRNSQDRAAFAEAVREAASQLVTAQGTELNSVPFEQLTLPCKEFFDGKGNDKKSAGWGLSFKSKFKPTVYDTKKRKLPASVRVGGGSVIRVASAFFAWEKPAEVLVEKGGKRVKERTVEYGISLRLGDVQVQELSEGASSNGLAMFDEVEGFEYDAASAEHAQSGDDATSF